MKKIYEESKQGYSYNNRHTYYLCETDEEYEELLEKYKDHENGCWIYDPIICRERYVPNHIQVTIGNISTTPSTIVLDGFCVHGGRNIKAQGITVQYVSSLQTDNSSFTHYIKPNTIEKNETVETESWWA